MQRRKDEREFQKEFAKDMRKLDKIKKTTTEAKNLDVSKEQEEELFASMLSKKKTGGNEQFFNKFVEGDLSIDDYTLKITQKPTKHGRGHKRGPRDNQLNKTA